MRKQIAQVLTGVATFLDPPKQADTCSTPVTAPTEAIREARMSVAPTLLDEDLVAYFMVQARGGIGEDVKLTLHGDVQPWLWPAIARTLEDVAREARTASR